MQSVPNSQLVGDLIWARTEETAARMNACEFATALREGALTADRYVKLITSFYPIVVGFNWALIRSLAKVDHVRDSWLVKGLAIQLQEEQEHNDLWREMLQCFGVDHAEAYAAFEQDMASISAPSLDRMAAEVVSALRTDADNIAPGRLPLANFPESVYALHQHMQSLATDGHYGFWFHFASQSAIEATIYQIVSASIYPGVVRNPTLNLGPESVAWWKEHAKSEGGYGQNTEEKHLYLARMTLNKSPEANRDALAIVESVEATLRLFAATFISHDTDRCGWLNGSPLLSSVVAPAI